MSKRQINAASTTQVQEIEPTEKVEIVSPEPVVEVQVAVQSEKPASVQTPADRKQLAASGWAAAVSGDEIDNDLVPTVTALFTNTPKPSELLDQCAGATLGSLDFSDPAAMQRGAAIQAFKAAISASLPTTGSATTVVDPKATAAVNLGHLLTIERMIENASYVVRSAIQDQIMVLGDEYTTVQPSDVAKVPSLEKINENPLPAQKSGGKSSGKSGGKVTDPGLFVAGATFQHGTGADRHVLEITSDGVWNVDGVACPNQSASGSARQANGGSSVNGKVYWNVIS